eukprot:4923762-Pleurochrysis_carterae.AAC.2
MTRCLSIRARSNMIQHKPARGQSVTSGRGRSRVSGRDLQLVAYGWLAPQLHKCRQQRWPGPKANCPELHSSWALSVKVFGQKSCYGTTRNRSHASMRIYN